MNPTILQNEFSSVLMFFWVIVLVGFKTGILPFILIVSIGDYFRKHAFQQVTREKNSNW